MKRVLAKTTDQRAAAVAVAAMVVAAAGAVVAADAVNSRAAKRPTHWWRSFHSAADQLGKAPGRIGIVRRGRGL